MSKRPSVTALQKQVARIIDLGTTAFHNPHDIAEEVLRAAADTLRHGYTCPSWDVGGDCRHADEFACAADHLDPPRKGSS